MPEQDHIDHLNRLLEFRSILQKLQLELDLHFRRCPLLVNKPDMVNMVNKYIDAADALLNKEIQFVAIKIDDHRNNNDGTETIHTF